MEKLIVKAKVKEFEIKDPNQPFKDDRLGRKDYAEILTGIVETFVGGAVIALNGAWGTGKTTFLKMWKQHMMNEGFPVIYYNAWEDDICEEPMLSMLRELKELNKEDGLDNVFRTGAKVVTGALAGAFTAAAGVLGEIAKGAVEGGMKQLEDSVYESLKEENARMKLMQDFKESLTDYMTIVCNEGKPMVYMVDELDRCNPTFAVKVLERIKHLFDVPNVIFVLSIDKKQLACSVKGFYGSNEIDADEYLRRFIDVDYYLPEPDAELFCDYLYDYYDYDSFLKSEKRIGQDIYGYNNNIYKAKEDKEEMLRMAKTIVKPKHLSLRQIERVFAIARIGLCSMPIKSEFLPKLFFFLSYLKVCESEMFDKIADFSYDLQGLVDALERWVPLDVLAPDSQEQLLFHNLMAITLSCYAEGYYKFMSATRDQIVKLFDDNTLMVSFSKFDKNMVSRCINSYYINDKVYTIGFITNRLRMLERLTN